MSGRKREPVPIMTKSEERFMAFEGLVQWVGAAVEQGRRVKEASEALHAAVLHGTHRLPAAQLRTEHYYFAIAAYKVMEHRDWVLSHGLCSSVDFSGLDQFSAQHIRDLRNMREHQIDYFRGIGKDKARWIVETPEFKADASSAVGSIIGGRLDWVKFAEVAAVLLPVLLAEPTPFPPMPGQSLV